MRLAIARVWTAGVRLNWGAVAVAMLVRRAVPAPARLHQALHCAEGRQRPHSASVACNARRAAHSGSESQQRQHMGGRRACPRRERAFCAATGSTPAAALSKVKHSEWPTAPADQAALFGLARGPCAWQPAPLADPAGKRPCTAHMRQLAKKEAE